VDNVTGLVSIIIVNWNTRDLLLQCLRSINENAGDVAHEVIVFDNGSSDGSADAVRQQFPNVKVIASEENIGFAAGNNRAAAEAKGEFLLFLNPDTLVMSGAINQMRSFLESNARAGAVGCRLLNTDGTIQQSFWMRFPDIRWLLCRALFLDKLLWRSSVTAAVLLDRPIRVGHLLGACLMMPSDVFRSLRGFNESYFLYCEETDLCYRLWKNGYEVYYLPSGTVVHLGQQSTRNAAYWTNVQLQLSTYAFIMRNGSAAFYRRTMAKVAILIGAVGRLALWTARMLLRRRPLNESMPMLRGYARLLRAVFAFDKVIDRALASGRPIRWVD